MKIGYKFDDREVKFYVVADWCNNNNAHVEKLGEHSYEIAANAESLLDIAKREKRAERDDILASMDWRVMRCSESAALKCPCCDEYEKLLRYRRYLREFPEQENFQEKTIKTLEEFEETE